MNRTWMLVSAAIVIFVLSAVMNGMAGGYEKREIAVIRYDVRNQRVLSVTDGLTGKAYGEVKVINGVPGPFLRVEHKITRLDVLQVISDVASPGCTCIGNFCWGSC